MTLRPHQIDLRAGVYRAIANGHDAVLAQAPTGFGKTHMVVEGIIAPSIAQGRRFVFAAHLEELIDDTASRHRAMGLPCGVVKSGRAADPAAPVQVASTPTLAAMLARGEALPPCDRLIIDEAHRASSRTLREIIGYYRARGTKILGLSVGPDSWVEMRGGPMGAGYVGPIEGAYDLARGAGVEPEPLGTFDCLRVEALGIEARGWDGRAFAWKPVKSMLRHVCDRPTRTIRVAGASLLVTDDHAVYRVEGTRGGSCEFVSRPSAEFCEGDVVAVDAGDGWAGATAEAPIDVLSTIDTDGMQVAVDLTSAERRALEMSPKRWYAARNRGPHGHHLAAAVYRRNRSTLPRAEKLYTEGAQGHWLAPSFLLSDWAYVLGFWLGNGWVNETRVCFSVKSANADFFDGVLRNLPHVDWNVTRRQMHGSVEFRCSSSPAAALFRALFGRVEAPEKSIPAAWITTWSEPARRALLDGLMDSDGHAALGSRSRERCYFGTTSHRLARGLLALLRSVGVSGSIAMRRPPCEGGVVRGRAIVGRHGFFAVHWSLHALRGDNAKHRGARSRFDHGGKSFRESIVRAIAPCDAPAFVYDLEMAGHPSFVADGVLVHNTATPARGDEQPLDEFSALVTGPSVRELIDGGFLVEPIVHAPAKVLTRGVAEDPAEVVNVRCAGRRAVVFASTAAHALDIAARIPGAETILDSTPFEVRSTVRDRLASGQTQHLVTVRALLEGFDAPVLDAVILCGAFTTVAPFLQAIGRGLRSYTCPITGRRKVDCHVYDLRGAVHLHGLPDDARRWSLEGAQGRSAVSAATPLRRCAHCHALYRPRPTCPACGCEHSLDARPLRIQRAEMLNTSGIPVELRARKYLGDKVLAILNAKPHLSTDLARRIASTAAPAWVREALKLPAPAPRKIRHAA